MTTANPESPVSRPNIVFISADQWRFDHLGCMGHPLIKTPHYDALAGLGTLFERTYSPNPICIPARATMITGNYSHKCTGFKGNKGAIRDDQVKLPAWLVQHGYATYSAGKLHYLPYAKPGEPRVLHGFQHAQLLESGRILAQYDPKNELTGLEDYIDHLATQGWKGYSRAHGLGNNDPHPAPSPLPEALCPDAWVATTAIDYIKQHQRDNPDAPFFLNVGFPKPHPPFDPPRPWDTMYDPREMPVPAQNRSGTPRGPQAVVSAIQHGMNYLSPQAIQVMRAHYAGLISFQDAQVGRIVAALKAAGCFDNTVIVCTADHGEMLGDSGLCHKSSMYEGSAHVPLIVVPPGDQRRGDRATALAGLQDLMPTVLDLAGVPSPGPLDGISLGPVVRGEAEKVRDSIVSYSLDAPQQTAMITDGEWKYIYHEPNGVEELFQLSGDPLEEYNRIDEEPDRAASMRRALTTWLRDHHDDQFIGDDGELVRTEFDVEANSVFNAARMGWRWY